MIEQNPTCSNIDAPALRDFFEIWQGRRGRKNHESSLEAYGRHVKSLYRIDFREAEDRFQVGFSGSGNCDITGVDLTGKYVDEMTGSEASLHRLRRLADNGKPYLIKDVKAAWARLSSQHYNVMCCPLLDYQGRVSSILALPEFFLRVSRLDELCPSAQLGPIERFEQ